MVIFEKVARINVERSSVLMTPPVHTAREQYAINVAVAVIRLSNDKKKMEAVFEFFSIRHGFQESNFSDRSNITKMNCR